MRKYTIFGVEEVYDAFDEYEHANALPSFCVYATSVTEAVSEGHRLLEMFIDYNQKYSREGFLNSGMFIPNVIQIGDEEGNIVYDRSSDLIRSWPFSSDERNLIPRKLPTQICFLSYSHKDTPFVLKLLAAIKQYSLLPWFDLERPDMPNGRPEEDEILRQRIIEGIISASVFIVTISDNSLASKWVEMEVLTALEKTQIVFGIQISPITITAPSWLMELQLRQKLLDFKEWQNNAWWKEQSKLFDNKYIISIINNKRTT